MLKKLPRIFPLFVMATLVTAGCGGAKASMLTSTTASTYAVPSQTSATFSSTTPTTATIVTSTAPVTSSAVPVSTTATVPATSAAPETTAPPATTASVYIIHATLGGVDDLDARVKVGTRVRWTPLGHEDRTLVSDIPGLFGGYLTANPWVEYTFDQVGTFYYHFAELPGFRTSIVVTA